MTIRLMVMAGLLAAAPGVQAEDEAPPVVKIPTLGAEVSSDLARSAYDACTAMGHRVAVAVVARDGKLVAFLRNPDSSPHTIEVAKRKAWSANTFRTATANLQALSAEDRFMENIPGALIIGGGMPINIGGFHYGAVGVSGAPGQERPGDLDDECAIAGIEAITDTVEMAE